MTQSDVKTLQFTGLTDQEVEASRAEFGSNLLTPPARTPWWQLYLEKFNDPVIRILIIAAALAILVGIADGKYLEGLGILIAIFLATTIAFVNEFRANREFDILNKVSDEAPITALRNGQYVSVAKRDIVVNDILLLEVGEEVPADADVLQSVSMQVDESRLTGESVPVTKIPAGEAEDETGDTAYPRFRMFRGTLVADGHGMVKVTAVGDSTEIGKTARAAAEETDEVTPLNRQLERLSKLIGVVGFSVAALIYAALLVREVATGQMVFSGQQWMFLTVLTIGLLIMLSKVWVPIVYDALELSGHPAEPPGPIGEEGLGGWLKTVLAGTVFFAAAIGITYFTGLIPAAPEDWLPPTARELLLQNFLIAVTIIVVAVPEGLAMAVTLSLAYSMRKMAAANNLVRRMQACETIGAATVICSDKTGTLTLNEMRVADMVFPGLPNGASGVAPHLVEAIAANSSAHLSTANGEISVLGNPTEGALLIWLNGNNVDYRPARDAFPITKQWTFSTQRKLMATAGHSSDNQPILHVKGAPEIVLDRCVNILTSGNETPLDDTARQKIHQELRAYQARGMRTLGFAYARRPLPDDADDVMEIARGLTWTGFAAIADPIRPEVPPAIETCNVAGIAVKIVTGDNSQTALEIARQINLLKDGDDPSQIHITGREFEELDDNDALEAAGRIKVLSRARPVDKMRLVRLLQARDEVVAVTGDGTNDAPALNFANVGLAMGKTGTAVAKEASDIILLDDSFKSITNAVLWGRSLYRNIQKFVVFQLTINVAALGVALLGPFIGVEFPLTVIQMLWVNLIMDTFAALALATEPPEPTVMNNPPRKSSDFIVSRPMAYDIFITAAFFLVILLGFLFYIQNPASLGGAEVTTYELSLLFTTFVLFQFWNLFNVRMLGTNRSMFTMLTKNNWLLAIAGIILVGQVLIVTVGGGFFRTVPLSLTDWIVILAGTSSVLWVGEIRRLIGRMMAPETAH